MTGYPRHTLFPLLVILTLHLLVGGIQLHCQPQWTWFSTGQNLPPKAVASHPDKEYIARILGPDGRYQVGSMELITGVAYIQGGIYGSYQILTNPFDCDISWVSGVGSHGHLGSPPLHAFSTGTSGDYVGRSNFDSNWLSGTVRLSRYLFIVGSIFFGLIPYGVSDYEIMTTYSPGLDLSITNFESDEPPPPTYFEYAGMSIYENNGDGDVIQTVTHTKQIKQSWSLTHSHSITSTHTVEMHEESETSGSFFGLIGGSSSSGSSESFSTEYSSSEEETVGVEATEEVTISDQIVVPAHTSIQVCSVISMMDGQRVPFRAKATYKARGLTGDEVQLVMIDAGIGAGTVEGDKVYKDIEGSLSIKSSITTKIIVLPIDAVRDCNVIATEIDESRKVRLAEQKRREEDERKWNNGTKIASRVKQLRKQAKEDVVWRGERGTPILRNDPEVKVMTSPANRKEMGRAWYNLAPAMRNSATVQKLFRMNDQGAELAGKFEESQLTQDATLRGSMDKLTKRKSVFGH